MADLPPDTSPTPPEPAGSPPQAALLVALRELCHERGVTLEEAAREAGLSGLIGPVAAGDAELRLQDVTALCAVLDVRVSELTARAEALGEP